MTHLLAPDPSGTRAAHLGPGVPQDDALAHVWCEIALARGMPEGLACREAASARLTGAEARATSRIPAGRLARHPAW